MLTREQILSADDRKRETVQVPEWGGEVSVSNMCGSDRDAFEESIIGSDGKPTLRDMRAKLVARCIVDESGSRIFSDEDVTALGRKSAAALDRCARVAQRLNLIGDKELEEIKGN